MTVFESILWRFRKGEIGDIALTLPIEALRRRAKIVVVDDEPDSFPTSALQQDGYTIESWNSVDGGKLSRLEHADFDIIILDIGGIVPPELSDTGDGRGVIRRIKSVNEQQIVVAFSGQTYDLSSVPFFKAADDSLRKPVTIIQCKELLDRLIQQKVSVKRYWAVIAEILARNNVKPGAEKQLEKRLVHSIQAGKPLGLAEVKAAIGSIKDILVVGGWLKRIYELCN